MHPLVQEYYEQWIAPDGQGKLEPSDERAGFTDDSPRITKNENGQLFLVMAYYEMDAKGILPDTAKDDFRRMVNLSRVPNVPGLFYRRFMDNGIRQSHDNLVGLVAGSLLFDDPIRTEIAFYGQTHGWCPNAQQPGVWDIRTCIQGGDIAFIEICNGYIPTMWHMFWFMLGRMLVPNDAGKINLSELRSKAISKALAKYSFPSWVKTMRGIADVVFGFRHNINGSTSWAIDKYFFREEFNSIYIKLNRVERVAQ